MVGRGCGTSGGGERERVMKEKQVVQRDERKSEGEALMESSTGGRGGKMMTGGCEERGVKYSTKKEGRSFRGLVDL